MKKLILLLLLLPFTQSVFGQNEIGKVGTTAANFLKLEVGARAVGMAGAYTAMSNDIYSLKWNPAGLSSVENLTVAYNNINLYADMKHWFAGIVIPMGGQSFGLSMNYIDIGKIEKTTLYEPDGTGLFFSNYDFDVGISFARQLTDRVSFGISARYVHEQIWQEKANGICGDVGIIFIPGLSGLRLGMSITNFGPDIKMDDGPLQTFSSPPIEDREGVGNRNLDAEYNMIAHAMPVSFQLGATFELMGVNNMIFESKENRLTVIFEVQDSFDNFMRSKYALEYEWNRTFAVRGGYKENYDLADFSFGGGLRIPVQGMGIKIDYAWAGYGDLGEIHVTSIELNF